MRSLLLTTFVFFFLALSMSTAGAQSGFQVADEITWTLGGFAAAALLAMGWWRHRSILGLRRRLEETLADLARTRQALLKANEAADIAERAKSEFLARMSHEMRTPLNSILGFVQLIETEIFGPLGHPKYREYAGDITESGTHLLNLINDVLDVSKIEAGMMDITEQDVDLAKVVTYAVRTVRGQAARGKVKVSAETPAETPRLRGDEVRLKQILLNLLTNAIKFTLPGGRVDINTHVDGTNRMVWRIADTGIGIRASDLTRILQPFQQALGDIHQAREGAGLGLYVTESLVKLHGGTLLIESEIDKGTAITVMFPPERTLPES